MLIPARNMGKSASRTPSIKLVEYTNATITPEKHNTVHVTLKVSINNTHPNGCLSINLLILLNISFPF
jgi:hypothetical protein